MVPGDGKTLTVRGYCTDRAGNTGSLTITGINIDSTAPLATPVAVLPPNANGWNNTPVTVSFAGTDSISGSGVAGCSASVALTAEGAGQTARGNCSDIAGNV